MKFLLTSAGLTNKKIKLALENLTGKPLSKTSVLFISTAANTGSGDKRWLLDNLNEFDKAGVKSLDILDIAGLEKEIRAPHFLAADVICIGGGDERYLARVFAEQNIKDEIEVIFKNKVYMGISAGSMIFGKYLPAELSKEIYPEEDFGDSRGEGMEFLPFSFIPHLNSNFFSLNKDRLDSMKKEFTNPVYTADDNTALVVIDGQVKKVGDGELLKY